MIARLFFVLLVLAPVCSFAQPQRIERNVARSKTLLSDVINERSWKDGELVSTQGYSVLGLGANQYRYHSTGRGEVTIDGGFFIAGSRADDYFEAVDKTVVNIAQWGITETGDNSELLETAIIAARANNIWVDGQKMTVNASVTLESVPPGSGLKMRHLRIETSTGSHALRIVPSSFTQFVDLKDCSFASTASGGVGLKVNNCHFSSAVDCSFSGTKAGIEMDDSFCWDFKNCIFSGKYGFYGYSTGGYTGLLRFFGGINAASGVCFVFDNRAYSDSGYGCTFYNVVTQDPSSLKYYLFDTGSAFWPTVLHEPYFETPMGGTIDASDIGLGTIDSADGGFVQIHGTSVVKSTSMLDFSVNDQSVLELGTYGGDGIFESGTRVDIDAISIFPGNWTTGNYDVTVKRIFDRQRNCVVSTKYNWQPSGYDQTTTTYLDPNKLPVAASGSPVFTQSVGSEPTVITTMDMAANDVAEFRGAASGSNFHAANTQQHSVITFRVRATSGTPAFSVRTSVTSATGQFEAGTEWQSYIMYLPPTTTNAVKLMFKAEETGVFEISSLSVTCWDDQSAMWNWLAKNKVAAGGSWSLVEVNGGHAQISIEDNATATTVASTQSDWSAKSQFTLFGTNFADSSNATPDHTNDHITLTSAGVWEVSCVLTCSGSVVSDLWELALWKNNGATQVSTKQGVNIRGAGLTYEKQVTISGLVDASANDTIELWVQRTNGTGTLTITNAVMTATKVSD